jgi:hypothetical protein
MNRKARFLVIAGVAIGTLAAVLNVSAPVEAGCQPVKAKGKGRDIATASTLAQASLAVKAAALGGTVTQTSSNCAPGPTVVVCRISAVVCPR